MSLCHLLLQGNGLHRTTQWWKHYASQLPIKITSHLFMCTCWLCCCLWFSKLVLRGTLGPDMWRWTLGHRHRWKTVKPSIDWFRMCLWASDSTELHLEVKARGWSRSFAAQQRLFASIAVLWAWTVTYAGHSHADEELLMVHKMVDVIHDINKCPKNTTNNLITVTAVATTH